MLSNQRRGSLEPNCFSGRHRASDRRRHGRGSARAGREPRGRPKLLRLGEPHGPAGRCVRGSILDAARRRHAIGRSAGGDGDGRLLAAAGLRKRLGPYRWLRPHQRPVLAVVHLGRQIELRRLLHPALFVPETCCSSTACCNCFRRSTTNWRSCSTNTGAPRGWSPSKTFSKSLLGEIRDEHRRERTDTCLSCAEISKQAGRWHAQPGRLDRARLKLRPAEESEVARLQHRLRPGARSPGPHPTGRRHHRVGRPPPGRARHGRPADRPHP